MELFAKIVADFKLLTIFAKCSILDISTNVSSGRPTLRTEKKNDFHKIGNTSSKSLDSENLKQKENCT